MGAFEYSESQLFCVVIKIYVEHRYNMTHDSKHESSDFAQTCVVIATSSARCH